MPAAPVRDRPWLESMRSVLRAFLDQVQRRAQRETELQSGHTQGSEQAEAELQASRRQIEDDNRQAVATQDQQRQAAFDSLKQTYEEMHQRTKNEFEQARSKIQDRYQAAKAELEEQVKDQRWHITAEYDSEKKSAQDQLGEVHHEADAAITKLEDVKAKAAEVLVSWNLEPDFEPPPADKDLADADPSLAMSRRVEGGQETLVQLEKMPAPRIVKGVRPYLIIVLAYFLSLAIGYFVLLHGYAFANVPAAYWSLVQATVSIPPLGLLLRLWLISRMEKRAEQLWNAILQADADARAARSALLKAANDKHRDRVEEITRQRDHATQKLADKAKRTIDKLRKQRDDELAKTDEVYPPRLKKEKTDFREKQQLILADDQARKIEIKNQHDHLIRALAEGQHARRKAIDQKHVAEWSALTREWKQACERFRADMVALVTQWRQAFPPWQQFPKATELPKGLRFGSLGIALDQIPHALPTDPSLVRPDWTGLDFPALLPFPDQASIYFGAHEHGREIAIRALEALLLRAWLALPPGKMRCTIIDPVGRGENFSAFMHLEDHDPALVNSRIWTEVGQIEQRLTDLTSQMETILQKFLRNQYETLAEYNAQAGEIAEPFRFLVVAHFPVNFSPDAAQRLLSLASSGARCGIYTFIVADTRQPLPAGLHWEDFEKACCTLLWEGEGDEARFAWQDEDFSAYPLQLEALPPDNVVTELLKQVGEKAVAASKVELPFDAIAPAMDKWWSERTDSIVSVPIGKAGARRFQQLLLGQGTSQHVLVAGKTGSGKSTLLHVLIMELALRYSPDEMELYLIDFKKGVEFKVYAEQQLPHARVVAVESEREFGLSVLQRLDAELVRRGELYRTAGVNDLASYRNVAGTLRVPTSPTPYAESAGHNQFPKLPRVLLIVDEFQEFFVEDDKIAQESSLLLDRLVRQGRAFGIHLLMGSQTLGGAYSLARATIDQMAIRIALQCSEADASLILSRENTEARLLSRPGEAIYNAAGGLLEGNQFFQIVWLEDTRRDRLLEQLRELAKKRNFVRAEPQIVFEGNAPAEPSRNPYLHPAAKVEPGVWRAWLGESVAIKDPACAVFRLQSGSNLLLAGQQQDHAFNLLAVSALSLARPGSDAQVSFILGQALEPEQEAALTGLAQIVPLQTITPRDLPERLTAWNEELERRLAGTSPVKPQFIMIYGFQRLRDLRKPDDDFGFGKKGEDEAPHRIFAKILREGPGVGLFTLLWCDNYNNLQRNLDRQGLREFEMRVLFQMNANDASNLMDSPLAAKLGPYRAYLYSEDQGRIEKFRPYGMLRAEWLQGFAKGSP